MDLFPHEYIVLPSAKWQISDFSTKKISPLDLWYWAFWYSLPNFRPFANWGTYFSSNGYLNLIHMSLILESRNHVINSHMILKNSLKLYQHSPLSKVLPGISKLSWREHVAWNLLFGKDTTTHSERFLNIHKAGRKQFFQILLIIVVKHWRFYIWPYH